VITGLGRSLTGKNERTFIRVRARIGGGGFNRKGRDLTGRRGARGKCLTVLEAKNLFSKAVKKGGGAIQGTGRGEVSCEGRKRRICLKGTIGRICPLVGSATFVKWRGRNRRWEGVVI